MIYKNKVTHTLLKIGHPKHQKLHKPYLDNLRHLTTQKYTWDPKTDWIEDTPRNLEISDAHKELYELDDI